MSVNMFERNASILEMAVEIDRRGAVIQALEADLETLKDMVADAYNAGFTEGMREVTSRKGGTPWFDSGLRKKLLSFARRDPERASSSKAEGRPTGSPPPSAR